VGFDGELESLLTECMKVFGELGDFNVKVCYKPLKSGVLGQTRIKKQLSFLQGKKRFVWLPIIEVSSSIRDLKDTEKRRELLRYVLVHELVHIVRSHIFRPTPNEHEKDFDREVEERLRRLKTLKESASMNRRDEKI